MSTKILIVKLSAIGDAVHALPVLAALRRAFPRARIDWVVEELAARILQGHPMIDHLYVFKKKWRKKFFHHLFSDSVPFFKRLRATEYDWALDLQGLTKSGLAARFSGPRRIVGFGDEDGRELNKLFTGVKVSPPPDCIHVVEKNLALLKPLGIENPAAEFPLPDYSAEEVAVPEVPFFCVNPGAGWITKRLPLPALSQAAARIAKSQKWKAVVVWGPGEEGMADDVTARIKERGAPAIKAPPTTLRRLCRLISKARFFLGGDTGPTHIAAAMNVPVASFFGASDSKRNAPWGQRCVAIQHFNIPCVPCWKTRCRFRDDRRLACLRSITAEELFHKAGELLSKGERDS